jgi:hypothetical protein
MFTVHFYLNYERSYKLFKKLAENDDLRKRDDLRDFYGT